MLGCIDNEVGAEEHEVGDLVAFCSKAGAYKLVDEPSETTAWDKNIIARFQVMAGQGHNIGIIIPFLTMNAPLPVKLLEGGLNLASVVVSGELIGLEVLFLLDVVDILYNLVEKVLIVAESLLEHNGLALPVDLVVLVEGGVGEEYELLLSEVFGVVAESSFNFVLVP